MMRLRTLFLAATAALSLPVMAQDMAEPRTITASEWSAYNTAFVGADGRVIDTLNGGISHSESQGYGLLLAAIAGDQAGFERIWTFTRTELMIREDGLAAWRWEPDASPHVTDINNATDGDILIAYALLRAGAEWGDFAKIEAAADIVRRLEASVVVESDGLALLLPGVTGFSAAERPDGPVINPSYWIFEAFSAFTTLRPEGPWPRLSTDGYALMSQLTEPSGTLPADWVSLASGMPVPAEGFAPEFGYNNIRLPLYLMRAEANPALLERYRPLFDAAYTPARVNVTSGVRIEPMSETGYRLIGASLRCVLDGEAVPAPLTALDTASYYGATLQLLALDFLRRMHPECLQAASGAVPESSPATLVGALQ